MEETETLLPGTEAIEQATGERVSYSTFWRWTQYGVKAGDRRVRLSFAKAGGKRKTSAGAVREFVAACAAAATGDTAPCKVNPRTQCDHERAERELAAAGF
jgi:hypothetical protein